MFIIVITFLSLLFYYLFYKRYSFWESHNVPYDKPFLFFGSFYNIAARKEHLSERFISIYKKFSTPYVGIYIFHQPVLVVRDPEILRRILVKDFDKFTNRNISVDETADPLAFHSLLVAKDDVWKNLRTKLTPAFTSGKMKMMFPLMRECVDDLYTFLDNNCSEDIEVKLTMKKYFVDIISTCAFGINAKALRDDNSEIFKAAIKLLDFRSISRSVTVLCFFFLPILVNVFRLRFADKAGCDFLLSVFKATLQERERTKNTRHDLIDSLNNSKLDDLTMAGQALTFFAAGNDTTSLTIAFACYELALNQTIQGKLRTEITEIYHENLVFSYGNVQKMKYLDMVVSETLRKYPLAPFLLRECKADYTFEETGFTLSQGMSVIVPISGLHYDPKYYPNPEKFDPRRFSDDNKNTINAYTYLPFGNGPRNCIGKRFAVLVSKVALAAIIKDFNIDVTDRTPVPLKLDPGSLFMQNKGGLFLKFSKI